jgi:hypothetical protein
LVNVVKGPLCRHEVHALHPVPYLENPLWGSHSAS